MTRSAFFQPRRAKDVQVEEQEVQSHAKMPAARPAPRGPPRRHKECDEGCAGRVWSRRSGVAPAVRGPQFQRTESRTEASYRFGTPEPSLEVLEEQLQEVMDEEEQLRSQLRDLEHQLAQACGADGEDYSHRKSRFKSRVEDLSSTIHELQQQRLRILEGTDPEVQEEQRRRDEIKKFKTSGGYSTEEAIDRRIEDLEQQMYDVAMELMQEKRVLAEIQSLQRQKEEVKAHLRLKETLRSDEEIIRCRLEDIGSQLKTKLQELQEANAQLASLEEERQTTLAESPLVAERSRAHHRLNECVQQKTQLERKVQGIQARERAKEEQRRIEEEMRQRREEEEERRRQAEEEEEERRRKFRDERRKLREERLREERKFEEAQPQLVAVPELPKEPPGSAEMRLLEQILRYCQKLLPKNNDSTEEKKPVEYNNPEGSLIIVPPKERSAEYLFAPPKPRRHEGKVRKRPPTSKLKKTKENQQVLLHSPLSLKLFEALGIVPPVNTLDVPATIDEVEERLVEHRAAAQRWELKRQELLEQKLQSELEKVREAQEERQQERRRRLNMALTWLQDFEDEAERNQDASPDQRGLEDLVTAARSMGATDQQLASAQQLLQRWKRHDAQAALREAMNALQELSAEAESEDGDHATACKDLQDAICKAKKAQVDPELLDEAHELLEAAKVSAEVAMETAADPAGSKDEEEAAASGADAGGTGEEVEDFVPKILNLDDDEELVFDLGM